jgi:hypothetical protein
MDVAGAAGFPQSLNLAHRQSRASSSFRVNCSKSETPLPRPMIRTPRQFTNAVRPKGVKVRRLILI